MASVVYWIHHPEHTDMFTQGYIGVSNDTSRRWEEHKNRPHSGRFKNAIKAYGWDFLVKKIVLIADKAYCLTLEAALRAKNNIGWNHAAGGGCPPKQMGNKFRAGKSPWNKGIPISDAAKAKISAKKIGTVAWNKGLEASEETRKKQSFAKLGKPSPRLGKKLTPETIEKMRLVRLGSVHSIAARKKMSLSRLGRKQPLCTCPHCGKIGGALTMPRWHFENCKEKANG